MAAERFREDEEDSMALGTTPWGIIRQEQDQRENGKNKRPPLRIEIPMPFAPEQGVPREPSSDPGSSRPDPDSWGYNVNDNVDPTIVDFTI